MKKKVLITTFLGKQGSGKGTQAELLVKKMGLEYVGTGDLIRERMKTKDFTGRKVKEFMLKGKLHPTCIIVGFWLDKLEEFKNKKNFKGIVFDGCPRKIIEAMMLDGALEWYEWDDNVRAVLIDISNKEAIKRLTTRRICKKCGNIIPFTLEFRSIVRCPDCGGELVKRADDTLPAIKKRLGWFKTEVQPVINFYRKTGRLVRINGEQPIKDVFKDVLKAIK